MTPGQHDDEAARHQRLDSLRALADQTERPASAEPATPAALPRLVIGRSASVRRWRAAALTIVAALVVVGVVIGAILRQSGLAPFGHSAMRPAPALVGKAYSLQGAGPLACPSTPAWSPDGKQIAVVALAQAATGGCGLANQINQITNIAQADYQVNGESSSTSSGPGDTYEIVILDTASGHIARTIKLPELSADTLCERANPCATESASPESVGWSPDGRTVAAFFTYQFQFGNVQWQPRGILAVAPADGSSAPRLLIAHGRVLAYSNGALSSASDIYSLPRFVWDLSTGSATFADIHRTEDTEFTTPFAQGYHLGTDGALRLDQQPQRGDVSPWRAGSLVPRAGVTAGPVTYAYQTSQWLWSADGRFVLPNLDAGAYVILPGVTTALPAGAVGLTRNPSIAPPDAATSQSVKAVAPQRQTAALARNPDGKLLATYSCGDSAGALTIRNVTSGATLAQTSYTYPLTSTSLGCSGGIGPIAWSPDGAYIASTDAPDGQIIVWQVNIHA